MNGNLPCLLRFVALSIGLTSLAICSTAQTMAQTISADSVLIRLIDEVDVPARAIGSLVQVHASEGMIVEKGDLLAQIDDTEAQLDHKRASFELDIATRDAENDIAIRSAMKTKAYAQAHYDRLQRADIAQPRSVSESELEKARLDAEQAEFEMEKGRSDLQNAATRKNLTTNAVALAERNIEVRKIVAPLAGMVVEALFHTGEWVKPGEKIFRIVNTKRLRVEGFIQANEMTKDLKGAPVRVVPLLDHDQVQSFSGNVVFVSPEIDPVNGQVRIAAEVENPDGRLLRGMRARMSIQAE